MVKKCDTVIVKSQMKLWSRESWCVSDVDKLTINVKVQIVMLLHNIQVIQIQFFNMRTYNN